MYEARKKGKNMTKGHVALIIVLLVCAGLIGAAINRGTESHNSVPDPYSDPDPKTFTIAIDGATMAIVSQDGTIEFGSTYEPSKAAQVFWDHMSRQFGGLILTDENLRETAKTGKICSVFGHNLRYIQDDPDKGAKVVQCTICMGSKIMAEEPVKVAEPVKVTETDVDEETGE